MSSTSRVSFRICLILFIAIRLNNGQPYRAPERKPYTANSG
ncbi:hypothetical protein CGRA01v4_11956 [Colletotrichum graminicola]|nr:hypothetical protein CGRA01v4_11956 [Colletotrichum graminicola]